MSTEDARRWANDWHDRCEELLEHPELDTDDCDVDLERELRLDEERIDAEMTRAELRGITPPSY